MNNEHTKVTELSKKQEKSLIDTKEVLASKQNVLREIGQIEAFEFINKLATVATLKLLAKAKELKEYVGLTYKTESDELATVANWDDFCNHILNTPRRTIDDRLLNLNTFGEEFFISAQQIGLGNRELRKLRQLPDETQQLVINSEEVDLGDKEAVKELIEDLNFKQITEKTALQKQLDDANQTVEAVRENSADKQQELDLAKEREAKRTFSQAPWQRQAEDSVTGMMKAKIAVEQGINQLADIFDNLQNDESLDDKAIDLVARSLLSEVQAAHALINNFTNEIFGVLGGRYRPDVSAEDTFLSLQNDDATTEKSSID